MLVKNKKNPAELIIYNFRKVKQVEKRKKIDNSKNINISQKEEFR